MSHHPNRFPLYAIFPLVTLAALGLSLASPQAEPPSAFDHVLVLDRIEGDWAVLYSELDTCVHLPVEDLPALAREGDILRIAFDEEGKVRTAEIDWVETRIALERNRSLLQRLISGD
ncbi:MAG: DUF3006 domain-containing protein [Firmicutes bacterium]|nr:DUF3006 domain-containing protein [Bacillota bacterium]